ETTEFVIPNIPVSCTKQLEELVRSKELGLKQLATWSQRKEIFTSTLRNGVSNLVPNRKKSGHQNIAHTLLDRGAQVDARDAKQNTPLHNASQEGHQNVVLTLLDRGAQVDARNRRQQTPLHAASFFGHHNVALTLLHRSGQVDARDDKQHTPLHNASQEGHQNVVLTLLDRGA
ncbi:unnamed protein product, partial [Cyprideis torosa]